MGFSIPTALVASYAVYCETKLQNLIKKEKEDQIYFLKIIPLHYRVLVYVMNTGLALYNFITGFDDYFIGALLLVSMNIVVNISKIIIAPEQVTIGNTKIKPEDFKLVEIKPLDEKNAKFTFSMTVRNRKIQRDLYLPAASVDSLEEALKRIKPPKNIVHSKKR